MKTFLSLIGKAALAVAGLAVIGVIFIYSGFYNVSATAGHSKPVEQIFRTTMMRSVVSRARNVTPLPTFNSQDRMLAEHAAGHYEMMCRTCHGAPGKKPDPWRLYPPAPDLADALRVTKWSDAEVFWIIKNGIKDTGMSAYGASHDDDDLWALTAFVRQLQTITPEQYLAASQGAPMKEGHGHEETPTPEPPQFHKH
jgi:cytochrome c553